MQNEPIEKRLGPRYAELVSELKLHLPEAYVSKTQTAVLKEIAKKYSVGEVHIRTKILPTLGLKPPPKERAKTSYSLIKPTEEEVSKIVQAYESGTSAKKILESNLLGDRTPSLSTITNILKRKSSKYKERNQTSQITEIIAKKILDLHVEGKTNQQISEQLSKENIRVSSASICNYLLTIGVDNSQGKTEEEKLRIYNEYMDYGTDVACERLKEEFKKISKTTVRRIVREVIEEHHLPERDNSDSYRTYTLNKNYFSKIDSEDKAYFLGFIATDGCVHKNTVSIELDAKDGYILDLFSKYVGSNKPVSRQRRTGKHENGDKYEFDTAKITLFSREMVNDLLKYGITPAKSKTLDVNLTQVPEEFHRHFWRGAVDGDGALYKTQFSQNYLSFGGTQTMAKSFSQFVRSTTGLNKEPHFNKIWHVVTSSIADNTLIGDVLYKDATLFLERKYCVYKSWKTP